MRAKREHKVRLWLSIGLLVAAVTFLNPAIGAADSPNAKKADACAVDLPALLKLTPVEFDQDLKGAWRTLAQRPGCEKAAANAVRLYRAQLEENLQGIYWHEGQLRALVGQTEEAIALFEKTKRVGDKMGWNAYVDATIAFVRGDRRAILKARRRLAATPLPSFDRWTDAFGKPVPAPKWPMNLDVVDALIACFGKSYSEAYGTETCRTKAKSRNDLNLASPTQAPAPDRNKRGKR